LALSARFCWMMGGAIDVESEEGQGSTFTVCLPVTVAEHTFPNHEPEQENAG
jgi:signal transduction histidine kinase